MTMEREKGGGSNKKSDYSLRYCSKDHRNNHLENSRSVGKQNTITGNSEREVRF